MRKPELLVPASSLEVLKIATVFGADAVYIGGEAFGLRAKARNFSKEEMAQGIAFAHEHGVKVYVTVNILAHNDDLPGVEEYLKELKERKIPMVIATSGDRKNAEAALKRLKVFSYFEGIFTASEIGSGKNQPDLYFAAALQLDTDPGQTWVFEDAWHAIRTAKSAGFKTVAVYDKANDKNLGQIWNHADIYLPDLLNFNEFWSRASEM